MSIELCENDSVALTEKDGYEILSQYLWKKCISKHVQTTPLKKLRENDSINMEERRNSVTTSVAAKVHGVNK